MDRPPEGIIDQLVGIVASSLLFVMIITVNIDTDRVRGFAKWFNQLRLLAIVVAISSFCCSDIHSSKKNKTCFMAIIPGQSG